MDASKDRDGTEVKIGDRILVHKIDERITRHLPRDELESLMEFVGSTFRVNHINTDGSMVVTKSNTVPGSDEIYGSDLAIFPDGAEIVHGR